MSFLTDILPPKAREVIYSIFGVAGIVLGSLDVAYGDNDPAWLLTATKVLLYLSGALGFTAAANVTVAASPYTEPFSEGQSAD